MGAVMRSLVLLLCLLSCQAFGESLYVRSDEACPLNGDGTTYACPESAGAAGAWNDSANANVIWGSGAAKVSAGDTLYLCGTLTDFSVVAGASGTAGNEITITTACPSGSGSISGGANNNFSIDITNKSYINVIDSDIRWAKRDALFVGVADSAGANQTNINILRNRISNVGATTLANHCHALYGNAITGTAALYRIDNFHVIDNLVVGTEPVCASSNNDGINIENFGVGGIVRGNEAYGAHEGIDISTGAGLIVESNYTHDNTHSGIKLHGIMGCMDGTKLVGNIVSDNGSWGAIWQDQENGFVLHNTIDHAGLLHGLDIESVNTWTGTCVPAGNTYENNIITADYNAGAARIYNTTKATFESQNTWNGNILRQVGSQTTLIYWTSDTGNNITQSNFAASWQATHTRDQQQVVPPWVGGTSPTTAAGYCLDPTSTLLDDGVYVGAWAMGFDGESLSNSPVIGARGACNARRATPNRRTVTR